jgi:hypothetical protein
MISTSIPAIVWRKKNPMTQPVISLLRFIWKTQALQTKVLTTFETWVKQGVSRKDVKDQAKLFIEALFVEQPTPWMSQIDLEQVDWDQFVEFLCQCFYCKRLCRSLPNAPSDDAWMHLTNEQNKGALFLHPQQERAIKDTVPVPLFPLEQKLLEYGGIRLVYRDEPDLQLLLERGEIFDEQADLVGGETGQCHLTVARLWREQKEAFMIGTGYALSADGLWRQHSWLFRRQPAPGENRLVETTLKRVKYFGIMLTEAEAERFSQNNM